MADVIKMTPRRSPRGQRAQSADAVAKILLFTGPRYERVEDRIKAAAKSIKAKPVDPVTT